MTRWKNGPAILCALAYVVAACVFLRGWVMTAPQNPGDPAAGDLLSQYYPMLRYGFAQLRAGTVPLWTPEQLAGVPLLASPVVSVVYPLYLPFLLFSTERAIEIDLVLHLAIAGLGTYLCCRAFGIRPLAAFSAGLVYAYCGGMMIKLYYPGYRGSVVWIPFLFWLVHRMFEQPSARLCAGVALVFGLSLLGGHGLQFTYVTALSLAPFVIVRAVERARAVGASAAVRSTTLLAAGFALGVLVAAIRLLPATEVTQQSWRPPGALGIESSAIMSFDPTVFVRQLINPSVVANPRSGARTSGIYREGYLGIVTLPLAVLGLVLWRRRAVAVAIALVGVGAALYGFGSRSFLFPLLYHLPGGAWFRGPDRAFMLCGFAVAVLSAAGLEEIFRRRSAWLGGITAFAIMFVVVALTAPHSGATQLAGIYCGLGIAMMAAAAFGDRQPWAATVSALGLGALIAADLWQGFPLFNALPSQVAPYFARNNALFETIRARQGLDRTYIWSGFQPQAPLYFFSEIAKAGLYHGVYLPTDYDGLANERFDHYFRFRAPGTLAPRLADPFGYYDLVVAPANAALANLLGLRFFVIREGLESKYVDPEILAGWQRLWSQDGVVLYENPAALPRAFVAPRIEVEPDPERVLDRLSSTDLRSVALVEKPVAPAPDPPSPDTPLAARITQYTPHRVEIEASAPDGGLLVLTDRYFPGWDAFVDGRQFRIHQADYLFRGVYIPPGRHVVEFVYRPTSVRLGFMGTTVGFVLVGLLFAAGRRARR